MYTKCMSGEPQEGATGVIDRPQSPETRQDTSSHESSRPLSLVELRKSLGLPDTSPLVSLERKNQEKQEKERVVNDYLQSRLQTKLDQKQGFIDSIGKSMKATNFNKTTKEKESSFMQEAETFMQKAETVVVKKIVGTEVVKIIEDSLEGQHLLSPVITMRLPGMLKGISKEEFILGIQRVRQMSFQFDDDCFKTPEFFRTIARLGSEKISEEKFKTVCEEMNQYYFLYKDIGIVEPWPDKKRGGVRPSFAILVDIIEKGGLTNEQIKHLELFKRYALLFDSNLGHDLPFDLDENGKRRESYASPTLDAVFTTPFSESLTNDLITLAEARVYERFRTTLPPYPPGGLHTYDFLNKDGFQQSVNLIKQGFHVPYRMHPSDLQTAEGIMKDPEKLQWYGFIAELHNIDRANADSDLLRNFDVIYELRENITNITEFLQSLPQPIQINPREFLETLVQSNSYHDIPWEIQKLFYAAREAIDGGLESKKGELSPSELRYLTVIKTTCFERFNKHILPPDSLPLLVYFSRNRSRLDTLFSEKGIPTHAFMEEVLKGNVSKDPTFMQQFINRWYFSFYGRKDPQDSFSPAELKVDLRLIVQNIQYLDEYQLENLLHYLSSDKLSEIITSLKAGVGEEQKMQKLLKFAELKIKLDKSPSLEIQRLKSVLFPQLLAAENPEAVYESIQKVFERNNLPLVAKVFRVFEILHPTHELAKKLQQADLSPVLRAAGTHRRLDIIYKDLLKVHIDSGNPSLLTYLTTLASGEEALTALDQNRDISKLSLEQQRSLQRFLDRMDSLAVNSLHGRHKKAQYTDRASTLSERIELLRKNLDVKEGQAFSQRIAEMFVAPLGFKSIEDVIAHIKTAKEKAHTRNVTLYENTQHSADGNRIFSLLTGDLVKGINHHFLQNILENGSVAKEYLGYASGSDLTPFDTDTSKVLEDDTKGTFQDAYQKSISYGYGEIAFVLHGRPERFYETTGTTNPTYDPTRYEEFRSEAYKDRHYGIRTGFPTTEVDYIIMKYSLITNEKERDKVLYTIARNGFYIPVVDEKGHIIFTPEDFKRYEINYTKNEQSTLREELQEPKFSPRSFIETLKSNPFIKSLYEKSAGVSEGYTIEQHTEMVMERFEKYFANNSSHNLVSKTDFRLLLALHDIGKPLGVEFDDTTSTQHFYTSKIVPEVLQKLDMPDISPVKIELLTAVANQDILGHYVKGDWTAQTTQEAITELAQDLGVSKEDIYKLLVVYYSCDASSYPGLNEQLFVSDGNNLHFSSPVKLKMDALEQLIT